MSSLIRMILLLALAVCVCQAQLHNTDSCICQTLQPKLIGGRLQVKEIQMFRETTFCPRVEIQVTMKNGFRYCLDPSKASKIMNIFRRK